MGVIFFWIIQSSSCATVYAKIERKNGGGPEGVGGERGGASPNDSQQVPNREVDASDGYPFETTPAFPQVKR